MNKYVFQKNLFITDISSVSVWREIGSEIDVVIKSTKKTGYHNSDSLQKEIEHLRFLQDEKHPNIVNFIESFESDLHLYLVLQYVCEPSKEVFYFIENGIWNSSYNVSMMTQLVTVISYLHSLHILHRDISVENILWDPIHYHLYIIDFGQSILYPYPDASCIFGKVHYTPPEVYDISTCQVNTPKVDVWQIGIVFSVLLFENYLWENTTSNDQTYTMFRQCRSLEPVILGLGYQIPSSVNLAFLEDLLTINPNERPDTQKVMTNPFFVHGNIETSLLKT